MNIVYRLAYISCLDLTEYCGIEYVTTADKTDLLFDNFQEAYDFIPNINEKMLKDRYYDQVLYFDRDINDYKVDFDNVYIIAFRELL